MSCVNCTCWAAVIVVIGLAACGKEQPPAKEPAAPPAPAAPPPIGAAPQCVDANDRPVVCEKDSECCEGFVCGRDPELNPREKYCIYAGG